MAAINIPIISESEYPLFREIGVSGQFPPEYTAFLELFNQDKKKRIPDPNIITVKTNINFPGFIKWFGTGRYATYQNLYSYAATIC
jgi:hypothetical protein